MASLSFLKAHGLGNDFIILRDPGFIPSVPDLCDRTKGVGADGVLSLRLEEGLQEGRPVVEMVMFNPDGSLGGMCGNGIRCTSEAASLWGWVEGPHWVRTGSRLTSVKAAPGGLWAVGMGAPQFDPPGCGVTGTEPWLGRPLPDLPSTTHSCPGWAIGMGNPHFVLFDCPDDPAVLGPLIEHHPAFPARTNVQFVEVLAKDLIRVRTWERGAGLTLACGSGACASFAACRLRELVGSTATVQLPGGGLLLTEEGDGTLTMTGPGVIVYEGVWPLD